MDLDSEGKVPYTTLQKKELSLNWCKYSVCPFVAVKQPSACPLSADIAHTECPYQEKCVHFNLSFARPFLRRKFLDSCFSNISNEKLHKYFDFEEGHARCIIRKNSEQIIKDDNLDKKVEDALQQAIKEAREIVIGRILVRYLDVQKIVHTHSPGLAYAHTILTGTEQVSVAKKIADNLEIVYPKTCN